MGIVKSKKIIITVVAIMTLMAAGGVVFFGAENRYSYDEPLTAIYNGYSSEWIWDGGQFTAFVSADKTMLYDKATGEIYPFIQEIWEGTEMVYTVFPQQERFCYIVSDYGDYKVYQYDSHFDRKLLYQRRYGYSIKNQLAGDAEGDNSDPLEFTSSSEDEPVQFVISGSKMYYLAISGLWCCDMRKQKHEQLVGVTYAVPYLSLAGDGLYFVEDDNMLRSYNIKTKHITEYADIVTDAYTVAESGIVFNDLKNNSELSYFSFATQEYYGLGIGQCYAYDTEEDTLYYAIGENVYKRTLGRGDCEIFAQTSGNVQFLNKLSGTDRIAYIAGNGQIEVIFSE